MSSATRGLYLPPSVLSLADLSWPARLILAEILDLHKVNGQVWANDQHFVRRLPGTSLRTVQGAIKELVDAGYTLRKTNQKAQHKRILTPTHLPQNLQEPPADFAADNPDLPQNLREPIAKSAGALPQNLQEPTADSADINYTLNTIGNTSQTPPPTPAEKKIGLGVSVEIPSTSLPAEVEVSTPRCEAPPLLLARVASAAEATEAKEYASIIGQTWKISELKNFQKWAKIAAFTKRQADLGQLEEVKRQFAAYRLYLQRTNLSPYRLDKYLGTPDSDYQDGEWCGCEWPEVAAETRTRPGDNTPPATPTRATSAPTKRQTTW